MNIGSFNVQEVEIDELSKKAPASYVSIHMQLGHEYTIQTRKTYSLLDLGGDIGGLQGGLVPIFSLIVSIFSGAFFTRSHLKNQFAIDNAVSKVKYEARLPQPPTQVGIQIEDSDSLGTPDLQLSYLRKNAINKIN